MSWKSTRRFFPVSHIHLRVSKGTSELLVSGVKRKEKGGGGLDRLGVFAWWLENANSSRQVGSSDQNHVMVTTKTKNLNHWNFFSATKSSSSLRTGNILRAGDLLSSLSSTTGQSVDVFLVKTIVSNCWQFQHQKQKMLEFQQKFPGYRSSHTLWISAKRSKHELQGSQKTRSPSWGSRWRRTAGGLLTTFLSTGSTKYP